MSRRHRGARLVAICIAVSGPLFGVVASPARAEAAVTTLYVGRTGCTDSGSGSQAHPFCTIGKGAAVAVAGQTVLVASGTYAEQVTVAHSGTATAPVVIRSAQGASVTVTGAAHGFVLSKRAYVTIRGFTVAGTTSYGISVSSSTHVVISGNTVTRSGHRASGQTASGIYLSGTTGSTVTGNASDANSGHGIYLTGTSSGNTVSRNEASENAEGWRRNANGIDVIGSDNTVIGNVVHDNEDSGLQFYPGGNDNLATLNVSYNNGDHGIDNLNVTDGRIIGNTVYHNCTSGINVEGTSGDYLVENNIAVDNAVYPAYHGISCKRRAGNIGIWDSAPATTTVDNNLVYLSRSGTMYVFRSSYPSLAAMRAATGQERRGIQADPRFVGAGSGHLALTEGSPAIDAANSAADGEQAADIAAVARRDDPFVVNTGIGPRRYDDLGAYEFVSDGGLDVDGAGGYRCRPI